MQSYCWKLIKIWRKYFGCTVHGSMIYPHKKIPHKKKLPTWKLPTWKIPHTENSPQWKFLLTVKTMLHLHIYLIVPPPTKNILCVLVIEANMEHVILHRNMLMFVNYRIIFRRSYMGTYLIYFVLPPWIIWNFKKRRIKVAGYMDEKWIFRFLQFLFFGYIANLTNYEHKNDDYIWKTKKLLKSENLIFHSFQLIAHIFCKFDHFWTTFF